MMFKVDEKSLDEKTSQFKQKSPALLNIHKPSIKHIISFILILNFFLQIHFSFFMAFATLIVIEKHARSQDVFIQRELFKGIESNYWGFLFEEFQWLVIVWIFAIIYFSWDFKLFLKVGLTWNASQCLHLVDFFTAFLIFGLFLDLLLSWSLLFLYHKQGFRIWFAKLFILNFDRFLNLIWRSLAFPDTGLLDSFNRTEHQFALGFVSHFLFFMVDKRIEPIFNHVLSSFF